MKVWSICDKVFKMKKLILIYFSIFMFMGVGYAVTKDTSHLYGDEGQCSDDGCYSFYD